MRGFYVAIIALSSMFTVSIIWVTTNTPFTRVISELNATSSGTGVSASAKTAMNTLTNLFNYGYALFAIFSVLAFLIWWYLEYQKKELVTNPYYGGA